MKRRSHELSKLIWLCLSSIFSVSFHVSYSFCYVFLLCLKVLEKAVCHRCLVRDVCNGVLRLKAGQPFRLLTDYSVKGEKPPMMLEVDARTLLFPRDMWWYLVIFFLDIIWWALSEIEYYPKTHQITPYQVSLRPGGICEVVIVLIQAMKLKSPSLTKTSRRTIACGAFHPIALLFGWGKDSTRWDITEKVIASMETARTLECLTRTRMCKKVNRFWFKMDTRQQATVSKHYYPLTTNSHWHASDASSVLALLPGTSSCKSRVRVSSHQSMLERNSHAGGWPENQSWHRSQCIDSTRTTAFPFRLASHNGQTAPEKREIKQCITQLPLVFAAFCRVGEVGESAPPKVTGTGPDFVDTKAESWKPCQQKRCWQTHQARC